MHVERGKTAHREKYEEKEGDSTTVSSFSLHCVLESGAVPPHFSLVRCMSSSCTWQCDQICIIIDNILVSVIIIDTAVSILILKMSISILSIPRHSNDIARSTCRTSWQVGSLIMWSQLLPAIDIDAQPPGIPIPEFLSSYR